MNLKKKELIVSIVLIIVFLVIGFNISVLATNDGNGIQNISMNFSNIQNTQNTQIPVNTTNTTQIPVNVNTSGSIQITNSTLIKDGEVNTTNTTNTNTNNPTQLADTGLEDLPWVIIGICAVSAIFAYKKIKEYNID